VPSSSTAASTAAQPWCPAVRRPDQATEVDNWARTPKTELQEWLQARRLPVPAYRIVATRGQAHAQTFEVECAVATLQLAERGEGRSRRTAEQEAARRMLDALKARTTGRTGRCAHDRVREADALAGPASAAA
jgi:dsRNA-specific ribonuclease